MNKQRRKLLQEQLDKLEEIREQIEFLKDEEQEYVDNMPDNLQGSERHESAEAMVSNLEEAVSNIEEAISQITEAIS